MGPGFIYRVNSISNASVKGFECQRFEGLLISQTWAGDHSIRIVLYRHI